MAAIKFEVDGCIKCPCLRNTEYGTLTCFFNDNIVIDPYFMDAVNDRCPFVEQTCEAKEET